MVFSVSIVADGEDKNGKLHCQQRPLQVSPCVKRFIYTNGEGELCSNPLCEYQTRGICILSF